MKQLTATELASFMQFNACIAHNLEKKHGAPEDRPYWFSGTYDCEIDASKVHQRKQWRSNYQMIKNKQHKG